MRTRLISGILFAATFIGLISLDAWLAEIAWPEWRIGSMNLGRWLCNGLISTLCILVLNLFAARELLRFGFILGFRPQRFSTHVFAAGFVLGPYVAFNLPRTWHDEAWGMFWLAIAVVYSMWTQAVRRGVERVYVNVSTTIFLIVFSGGLAGYLSKLRMEIGGADGAVLMLFTLFVVKMTDTGAYFIGSAFGRNPLAPWLSPKKTWEGFIGGFAIATLSAVLVGRLWLFPAGFAPSQSHVLGSVAYLCLFGVLMAAFAVGGDLIASLLKRDAHVKDSGESIPGMGGMLDVIDSPLLAAPAAWFFWTRVSIYLEKLSEA